MQKSKIANYLKGNFVYCSLIIYGPLFGRQDHTSQDHFCSVIDEFPVWNSEPNQPTMMSWAAVLEREKVLELLMKNRRIDDRSSYFNRKMEGTGVVWVVFSIGIYFL